MKMEPDSSVMGSVTISHQCFEPLYIQIKFWIHFAICYVCLFTLFIYIHGIYYKKAYCNMFCLHFCAVLDSEFIERGN